MSAFFSIFATVFLAELGDKTQLATMLFAADKQANRWLVFAASALALVCASAMGVLAGQIISGYVPEHVLKKVAGAGFIIIGLWVLLAK